MFSLWENHGIRLCGHIPSTLRPTSSISSRFVWLRPAKLWQRFASVRFQGHQISSGRVKVSCEIFWLINVPFFTCWSFLVCRCAVINLQLGEAAQANHQKSSKIAHRSRRQAIGTWETSRATSTHSSPRLSRSIGSCSTEARAESRRGNRWGGWRGRRAANCGGYKLINVYRILSTTCRRRRRWIYSTLLLVPRSFSLVDTCICCCSGWEEFQPFSHVNSF